MLARLALPERVKVTAAAKLHEQARKLVSLEMRVKGGKEGMVQGTQNVSLSLNSGEFLPGRQGGLVHDLHGEETTHPSKLRQIHTPNVPKPQLLQQPELPQPQIPIFSFHALNGVPSNVVALVRLGRAKAPKAGLVGIVGVGIITDTAGATLVAFIVTVRFSAPAMIAHLGNTGVLEGEGGDSRISVVGFSIIMERLVHQHDHDLDEG